MDIDFRDKREQRKFGLLVGGIIILIGSARWAFHGFESLPIYWWWVGTTLALLGLIIPIALQPVLFAWLKLAKALNWLITHLLLITLFYIVITPLGIGYRLLKEDPLHRAWLPDAESYWDDVDVQPKTIDEFRRQF